MGRFIPKSAGPVDAFQWKSNRGENVYELVKYLNEHGHNFELVSWPGGSAISVIIGFDDDDRVRVDEDQWIVFDRDMQHIFENQADFYARYEAMP